MQGQKQGKQEMRNVCRLRSEGQTSKRVKIESFHNDDVSIFILNEYQKFSWLIMLSSVYINIVHDEVMVNYFFVQRGHFLFREKNTIHIYVNKQIPFNDHFLPCQLQISEKTVQWEKKQVNIYTNAVSINI